MTVIQACTNASTGLHINFFGGPGGKRREVQQVRECHQGLTTAKMEGRSPSSNGGRSKLAAKLDGRTTLLYNWDSRARTSLARSLSPRSSSNLVHACKTKVLECLAWSQPGGNQLCTIHQINSPTHRQNPNHSAHPLDNPFPGQSRTLVTPEEQY